MTVRPGLAQCVVGGQPTEFIRSDNETRLLARVMPGRPLDTLRLPRRPGPGVGTRLGQVLAVEEADGSGARSLGADSLAIIVRWVGPDDYCNWNPATDSLATGSRHLFTATLRPDSLWINGRSTFDVRSILFADFSESPTGGPRLSEYRSLLATMPDRREWETDCRPGVRRVERWLESHKDPSFDPFTVLHMRLRPACEYSVQGHVSGLERWKPSTPIPNALRRVFREQRCRDDPDVFAGMKQAVDGHFLTSDAQQWVFICAGVDDWRLLVVVLESPPRVIELARLAGHDWDWLAGSAPAEYFHWASSRDFGSGRWHVPRPRGGVVLLKFLEGSDDQTIAFFEIPGGWIHVGVSCCSWPE